MSVRMAIMAILGSSSSSSAEYYSPVSGDITFTDSHFQYSRPGYAGTGYTARSPQGFVEFRTSETNISVKVGGNWSGQGAESNIEVFVNDVWNQSVTLTADDTTQTVAITLPAGTDKIVRLTNGYTANTGVNIYTPLQGVYVQGVVTTGDIEIKIPVTPETKFVFEGDSITVGASSSRPAGNGYFALLRLAGQNVQNEGWGAKYIGDPAAPLIDAWASYMSEQLNGTTRNVFFEMLGTNDFGALGNSKATYKTYYGNRIDALHALRPDVEIVCVSPIERNNYDTPNGLGADLEDYADAIQELLATRPWAEFIHGRALVSLSNLGDGVHPNTVGHDEMFDNLFAAYGSWG